MIGALAGALALLLQTGERALDIQRFDANIAVNRDGSIDVSESIKVHFIGSWNGIYRVIPVKYQTNQGVNWTIQISLVSATDEQGTALRTETSRNGSLLRYKLWVPGARDDIHTITLRYHAWNALRFFEDHDELYWNVTGNEWDVALGLATATITLPDAATGLRATAFTGTYGSTGKDAGVAIDGKTVRITMPRKLEFKEGLTAVVGWNKGAIVEPTSARRAMGFLGANWPILLPIPVLIFMLMHWNSRGRDPDRLPVSVQYEPPAGMTPAEAGTITDESVDMRDITASMVDLAVRGYLKIEEIEDSKLFGLIKEKDYVFHRLKPDSKGLASHEQRVLTGLFSGSGDVVKLSDLKNEFYKNLPGIRDGVMERLVEQGLYVTRPDSVRNRWRVGGVVLGAITAFGGSTMGARIGMTPLPWIVAGFGIGIIFLVIGHNMPARTVKGARALEKVLGFSEFLERVDKERFERVIKTPELFEKYLPFAMALGVDKQWAGAFKDIYTTPPNWYVGSNMAAFNAASFSHSLSALSTSAGSAMSSAPRSSGGSGFSGGSSGGGGGGGGGGGF